MGNRATDQKARQSLRRRLKAAGVAPLEIERRVAELRSRQGRTTPIPEEQAARDRAESERARKAARRAETRAVHKAIDEQFKREQQQSIDSYRRRQEAEQAATWDRLSPDDSKYRPTAVDPLRAGPARVTPDTAKAARRRKATTKFEYDREAAS